MVTCPKCSADAQEDQKFCSKCGASLTTIQIEEKRRVRDEDTCFGEGEKDRLGLVSFGFLIIILGIVYMSNPNVINDFLQWIELILAQQFLVRPSDELLKTAKFFFILIGVSNFIMAAIRLALNDIKRRVISNTLSGIAFIFFGYFIQLYATRSITWMAALAYEAITVGFLVMVYSVLLYLLKKG